MKRLVAMVLIVTLGSASAAIAEESLLASAARAVRAMSGEQTVKQPKTERPLQMTSFAKAAGVREAALAQQQGGALSTSGLSKRSKTLIIAAVAVAYVGIAYGIDHKVRDVTPSSLGTRDDDSVFKK
jgi:hypothetical protein